MQIRTIESMKKQLKYTGKDKIIEMFYNIGLKQIKLVEKLKEDIKECKNKETCDYIKVLLKELDVEED